MAKVAHESNTTRPVESYGTGKENIVAYLDIPLNKVFDTPLNDKIVIAKDKYGLYVTAKSIAESRLLDPYKMYMRVEAKEVDGKYEFAMR